MKPFYRSRKFLWALCTLLPAVIVQYGPELFPGLQGLAAFQEHIGWIFVLGLGGMLGHTMTDIASMLTGGQKPVANIPAAVQMLIEAIMNPEEDTAAVEAKLKTILAVAPASSARAHPDLAALYEGLDEKRAA